MGRALGYLGIGIDTSIASANEVQATTEHLATGSEEQATQIVDTSAALDEMAVSIQQVSENAALSATVGEQATANAKCHNVEPSANIDRVTVFKVSPVWLSRMLQYSIASLCLVSALCWSCRCLSVNNNVYVHKRCHLGLTW